MEAKHTPGPWKFGKELTARSGEWLVSFDAGSKGRGIAIAETRTGPGSEEANARLIASAPDLLAALDMARSLLVDIEGYSVNGASVRVIDAAIAKATGGQP